jgi:DNA-binding CsgD family transcriptional regulator
MRKRIHDKKSCTAWLTGRPLMRSYSQLYPSVISGLERALNSAGSEASAAINAILLAARQAEIRELTRLADEFDLSPAESALAHHLADGGSISSFAKLRGVTLETVRSQLRSVFAKMGVRRQSELVAAVVALGIK